MATEINNQVVQMKFNNQEFEKNVQQTLTSLEKLDESLQFKEGGKGFDTLSKAAEEVKIKFSALEVVAISALNNITNKAINAGEKLVKSLSVDNIAAGWQKFEDTTTSVGTLISQGFSMEEVTEQLEKLNWFTDETSYNFTEMVSNIGKFTASGQGLEESVTAMMGIANWAALSGQNAQKASMAMYQLSQAMSKGVLKYDDWKSISNASMDTREFRQNAAEAAVAIGTLRKEANGLYTTLKGHTVSLNELFSSDYMSRDAWFTKDVMMSTFTKYSSAVNQLYEAVSSGEFETASEAIAAMGDQVDQFGLKAFRAAQEARTWTDVVSSVKDAVSSKWKTTFEMIIGDYQEAKNLFTGLANLLYDVFASSGDERNEVLALWKGLEGREKLLDGLAAGFYAIKNAVDAIKEAFYTIFSSVDRAERIGNKADKLLSITESFRKAMYGIANFVTRNAGNITSFFKGIFSVIKMISDGITGLFHALIPATKSTGSLFQIILSLLGAVGKVLSGFTEWIRETQILSTVMNVLKVVMTLIGNLIYIIISGIGKFASYIKEFVKQVAKLRPIQTVIKGISYVFALTAASVLTLIDNIKNLIITLRSPELTAQSSNPIVKVLAWIRNGLVLIGNVAVLVARKIVDFVVALRQISFKDIFEHISNFFANAKDWILTKVFGESEKAGKSLIDVFKELNSVIGGWIKQLDLGTVVAGAFVIGMLGVAGALSKMLNAASGLFGNASGLFKTINNWIKKTYAKSVGILNIAEAIAILSASLWLLSKVPKEDLTRVTITLGGLIAALGVLYVVLMGITKGIMKGEKVVEIEKTFQSIAAMIRAVSLSIVAVGAAMIMLDNVNLDWDMVKKLGLVIATVTILATVATALSFLTQLTGKKKFFNVGQIVSMILGILAISLSLKKITSALIDLSKLSTADVENATKALVPLMIAFGALAMGAGQVKLTSVAALFLLIKLMEKAIPEIATLSEQIGDLSNIIPYISADELKMLLGTVLGIIGFMGIFGKNISKAALGISMLVASVMAISLMFAKLNASGATILTKETAGILILLGVLIMGIEALSVMTKESKLIAFAGAMLMLVPVVASFGLIAWGLKKLHLRWEDTIPLQVIMFGIGLLMTLAGDTKNSKVTTLIALFAGLNGLFLEMIALSLIPYDRLLATAASMALVMLGLSSVLNSFSKLQRNNTIRQKGDFGKKFKGIILVLIEFAAVVGTMIMVAKTLKEMQGIKWDEILSSAAAISILLIVMAGITKSLSKIEIKDKDAILTTLGIMIGLVAEMVTIAFALKQLAAVPWEQLKNAMIAMNVTLGVLTIATAILGKIASTPAGIKALGLGLLVLAAGLGILCIAMTVAVEVFKKFASALTEIQNAVAGDPIGRVIEQIINGVSLITNNAEYFKQQFVVIGAYIVEGIIQGINDNLYLAELAGIDIASAVLNGTETRAAIASPSKVMYNNGVFMVLGLCSGVLSNLTKAKASGAALALSSVEGVIDNADKAYVAGAVVGDATTTGYANTIEQVPEVADAAMEETNDIVIGSVIDIEDEVVATTDRIEENQQSFWSNLWSDVKTGMSNIGNEISYGLGQAAIAFDDFTGSVSSFFGGSGKTLSGKIQTGIDIKKNVSDLLSDPVGTAQKWGKQAISSLTGSDSFLDFGDALSQIRDDLGINGGNNYFEQIFGEDGGAGLLENAAAGLGGVGSAAEKTKDVLASLKDTVEQQMDLFSEFNLNTEMTAEDMLRNMSSQILGIQGWADNLTVLAARGMDEGLLKMLGDLGPQAYEKVMAFAQMTDEQLQEANNMYKISLKLPGSAANQVFAGYTYAGEMAAKGFSNALDQYWGLIDPEYMGQKTIEDIAAGMTEYTHVVRTASGGAGRAAKDNFNSNAPSEEDGIKSMREVALGISGLGQVAVINAIKEVSAAAEEEERKLLENLSNFNYSYSAIWSSLNGSNISDRGFGNSKSGMTNGEGLSEAAKKRLGITSDGTLNIEDDNVPKAASITLNLNTSQYRAQLDELHKSYGTEEIQLAAAGVDRRIEASRQMENKILTEAFKVSNQATMEKFSKDICAAITSTEKPVTVNVQLQGDAQELFKMVRQENVRFTRINGYNALA